MPANSPFFGPLFVPLEKQQRYYIVTCELPLANDTLTMPCGGDEVILLR